MVDYRGPATHGSAEQFGWEVAKGHTGLGDLAQTKHPPDGFELPALSLRRAARIALRSVSSSGGVGGWITSNL